MGKQSVTGRSGKTVKRKCDPKTIACPPSEGKLPIQNEVEQPGSMVKKAAKENHEFSGKTKGTRNPGRAQAGKEQGDPLPRGDGSEKESKPEFKPVLKTAENVRSGNG